MSTIGDDASLHAVALRAAGLYAFHLDRHFQVVRWLPEAPDGQSSRFEQSLKTWLQSVHRADRTRVRGALRRAELGERSHVPSLRLRHGNSKIRWFDLELLPSDPSPGREANKDGRDIVGWLRPTVASSSVTLERIADLLGDNRGADHLPELSLRFSALLSADAMFIATLQDETYHVLQGQVAVADGRRADLIDIDRDADLARTVMREQHYVQGSDVGLLFPKNRWVAEQGLQALAAAHLRSPAGESLGIAALGFRLPLRDLETTRAAVTLFAAYVSTTLYSARSERRRFRSLEAFAHQGAALAQLSRSDIWRRSERGAAFSEITETGARTLNVSRLSVWLYDPTRETLELQDLFDRSADKHSSGALLQRRHNPSYFDALDADRAIVAQDARADPRSRYFAETYLIPNGVKSIINAPIRMRGRTEGVLFCEETEHRRQWTSEEISFIGSLADYCAMAMAMERRKELEQQLFQAQKTDSIGRLSGGVAHDFNNLLTAITGCAELALDEVSTEANLHDYLEDILEAAGRGAELTGQLLAFARQGMLKCQVIDLNDLIHRTERILNRLLGEDVELSTRLQENLWTVHADPGQLEQILINLAVNARDAMPSGGRLLIESYNRIADSTLAARFLGSHPGQALVEVRVSDTGTGIEADALRHIFEPFFTTKAVGSGTGLGLAMCEGIVAQAGGYIEADSEPGRGTRFHIFLPRYHAKAQPLTERHSYAPTSNLGKETLLLIEDDPGVRRVTARGLQSFGYRVLAAATAEEALTFAKTLRSEIGVVITDLVMPNMNGRELALELARFIPGMKVLYISGYSGRAIDRRGLGELSAELVTKPFTPSSLAQRVRKIIDGPAPAPLTTAERL